MTANAINTHTFEDLDFSLFLRLYS